MFEEGKTKGRKGERSVSTANIKAETVDDAEVKELERRRRRAKSTLDLRADKEEDKDDEQDQSRLKVFLNFFRNLRSQKEKQADQVISLMPETKEEEGEEEEEGEIGRKKKNKEKKEDKEEKLTISERYRLWRERKAKLKKGDEETEEEKKKQKKKKEEENDLDPENGSNGNDSDQETKKKKKNRKKRTERVETRPNITGMQDTHSSEDSEDDGRSHSHFRAGQRGSMDLNLGSLSDLSIDNLELPQEYSNRDLDHRIQTAKPSSKARKRTAGKSRGEALGLDDSDHDSARAQRPRKLRSGFDVDLHSRESEKNDEGMNGTHSLLSGSALNRFRLRLRQRHSKEAEVVESLSELDSEDKRKKSKKRQSPKKKASEDDDAASYRIEWSGKSSVSKSSKHKKKKKGKKDQEGFDDFPSSDSDPEVIVEEQYLPQAGGSRRRESVRPASQVVHVTYLSSDSDDESVIVVDRRRQNFVDEGKRRFGFLRRGRKEKKSDTGTRITPLTEGSLTHYSLELPMMPDEPWDAVEYDPDLNNNNPNDDEDDDFIDLERLQNLLADPSERNNIVVVDTRDYNSFLQSRLLFAKHLTEFENAEAEILTDLCSVYTYFVLYDINGRTLSLMDSPLSKIYDFLKKGSEAWRIFVIDGGFERVASTAPHFLCKSHQKERYEICPSVCDATIFWGNFEDIHITRVIKRYNISHVITFEGDIDAKVPSIVESILLKIDHDSVKLFDVFEELFKFMILGKSEVRRPSKLLLTCSSADNRTTAAVIAYMMFRHHWTLQDAFIHVAVRRKSIQVGRNNFKALQKLEKRLFGKLLTKSMPRLKQSKQQEDKKKKVEADKEEEATSETDVVSGRKTKKKKGQGRAPKEESETELHFSDEAKEKSRKGSRKKKKAEKSLPTDDEISLNSSVTAPKQNHTSRRYGFLRKTEKRRDEVTEIEKMEDEDADAENEQKRKSRSASEKKKFSKSETKELVDAENESKRLSEEAELPEEETPRRPRPKKRGGLLKLKRTAQESAED